MPGAVPLVSVDGTIGADTISVLDDGLLRGDGVFEVVRVYAGAPYALDEHLERMAGSARGLRLPVDLAAVRADAAALLAAAGPVDARLRLVATRGGRRIVALEPLEPVAASVALVTVEYVPTRLLDGIKSLSYGANMLAGRIARERGADEALLVTPHGRVLEAPTAAFFYVLDGALCTPPLSDHVLDSITRRRLMGVVARERITTLDDLGAASEAFLASTTREVQPVHAIDGRALAVGGPRTGEAGETHRAAVADALSAAQRFT